MIRLSPKSICSLAHLEVWRESRWASRICSVTHSKTQYLSGLWDSAVLEQGAIVKVEMITMAEAIAMPWMPVLSRYRFLSMAVFPWL